MLVLTVFLALAGPRLPFARYEERFLESVVPHWGDLAARGRTWREALPSDDGKLLTFKRGRYRWAEVRGGIWSDDEAVFIDTSAAPEVLTTSQEAHSRRPAGRRLAESELAVASFSDCSVLTLFGTGPTGYPYRYACLIRFRERGAGPNPTLALCRPLTPWGPQAAGQGQGVVLTRQGEDTRRPGVVAVFQHRDKLTVASIRFRRRGKSIGAEYGPPILLPAYVHRTPGKAFKEYAEWSEFIPPFAVDLATGKALYDDYRLLSVGGRSWYYLGLHEYVIRSHRWRDVAAPPGFEGYMGGAGDGTFYWHGRLLFSPQRPNGIPDVHGHVAFEPAPGPGSIGLYEASADRKRWRRISDCQVLALSASKTFWLVRDPKDNSYWIEHMR